MWTFFDHLLSKGGVVAVLFGALAVAFALVVRALWNSKEALARELREASKAHEKAILEIQEKRLQEAQAIAGRLMDLTLKVDSTMDKLRTALNTLATALQERRW